MKKFTLSGGVCTAFVVLAACLWGTTGLFVRRLNDIGLTTLTICVMRSLVAFLMMLVLALCIDPKLLRVRLRDLWCFLGNGVMSMLFFNYCYFRTIEESSMAVAATMLYTAPVFVLLLSALLFRERITSRKVVALVLAVIGCVLVSGLLTGGGALNGTGVLLGLGAGFGYGLYSIFTRFALNRGYSSVTISLYTFLFSALGGLPLTDWEQVGAAHSAGGVGLWLFLALYALVTTVLPYLFYNWGLIRVENSKASVIASVEPVMAALLGLAVFHEIPGVPECVGILLVLAAVVLLNVKGKKNEP